MRIVSKEYKIYKFDELNDDVKTELIEKERHIQSEGYCEYCLNDDMGLKASDLLNDYFNIESDYLYTYYDLSYSQGSGAMIEFDINIKDLNKKYKIFSDEEIRFLMDKGIVNDIRIRHNDNYYYHEYTFGIDWYYYGMGYSHDDVINEGYNIDFEDFKTLKGRLCDLLDDSNKRHTSSKFIKDVVNMNKELTRYGYGFINHYAICDERIIIDLIKENNYEYLENGEVFYG